MAQVQGATTGDAGSAERILDRYGDRVYRLAMRITGVPDDAEAAAREALGAAAWRTETLPDESEAAWVDRIAARAAYQRLLGRRPTGRPMSLDDLLPALNDDGHFGPMADWSNQIDEGDLPDQVRRVVTDAIEALPADYRTAFVLHDVEGMSDADIAETLGVAISGAKSRVHRSRLFLRRRLSEYFPAA
jgi:RNA polymerase sigma-70 factor, ECF subfamily